MTVQDSAESKPAAETKPALPEKKPWQRLIGENVRLVAIALFIAIVVRLFVAEPRFIPSDSMRPTLAIGDRLLVEKVSYRLHPPQPGEIIVFQPPPLLQKYGYPASQAFIKRVIAGAGQTVRVSQGQVFVDGEPRAETYLREPPRYEMPAVSVPAGNLFVMGDNRNDSNDSHVWGYLPEENVIGRAAFRFWPPDKFGPVPQPPVLQIKTADSAAALPSAGAAAGAAAVGRPSSGNVPAAAGEP